MEMEEDYPSFVFFVCPPACYCAGISLPLLSPPGDALPALPAHAALPCQAMPMLPSPCPGNACAAFPTWWCSPCSPCPGNALPASLPRGAGVAQGRGRCPHTRCRARAAVCTSGEFLAPSLLFLPFFALSEGREGNTIGQFARFGIRETGAPLEPKKIPKRTSRRTVVRTQKRTSKRTRPGGGISRPPLSRKRLPAPSPHLPGSTPEPHVPNAPTTALGKALRGVSGATQHPGLVCIPRGLRRAHSVSSENKKSPAHHEQGLWVGIHSTNVTTLFTLPALRPTPA